MTFNIRKLLRTFICVTIVGIAMTISAMAADEDYTLSVTLPTTISAHIDSNGVVTVAEPKITNNSSVAVYIPEVSIQGNNNWEVNNWREEAYSDGTSQISIRIGDSVANKDGTYTNMNLGLLKPGESKTLDIDIDIPVQFDAVTDNLNVASITYKVEFAGYDANEDWEYTTDDSTNTITLTKYIGESTDIVIHNKYYVGNTVYNNVIEPACAMLYDDGSFIFQRGNTPEEGKTLVATYTGFENTTYDYENSVPWYKNRSSIITVSFKDKCSPVNTAYWFYSCSNLTSVDTTNLDTSNVASMNSMFSNCYNLTDIDVSNWNTSRVVRIQYMFSSCEKLTTIDVSKWDTHNLMFIDNAFSYCSNLNYLDVSKWNLLRIQSMRGVFNSCRSLTYLDLSKWNTSYVRNMDSVFSNCGITNIDLSNFNTSNVTSMSNMFSSCKSLTNLDLSSFDTSKVTNMSYMFYACEQLKNIYINNNFITNKVTNSNNMFQYCEELVGGNGTTYDSSHIDATYARIDGVGGHGYFTAAPGVVAELNYDLNSIELVDMEVPKTELPDEILDNNTTENPKNDYEITDDTTVINPDTEDKIEDNTENKDTTEDKKDDSIQNNDDTNTENSENKDKVDNNDKDIINTPEIPNIPDSPDNVEDIDNPNKSEDADINKKDPDLEDENLEDTEADNPGDTDILENDDQESSNNSQENSPVVTDSEQIQNDLEDSVIELW